MAIIYNENSQLTARELVHPREYEQQATYRGYLFGPFRLFRGEQAIGDLMQRRNKARMILKWFLLNPGKLGSADEFIDLFWPEISPEKTLGNFHVTMHCLRHMLEPTLNARQESAFIRRKPNNFYWFQTDESWWTDTSDVEMLLERARAYDVQGDNRRASYYYRKVASYCSRGFLPEDRIRRLADSLSPPLQANLCSGTDALDATVHAEQRAGRGTGVRLPIAVD